MSLFNQILSYKDELKRLEQSRSYAYDNYEHTALFDKIERLKIRCKAVKNQYRILLRKNNPPSKPLKKWKGYPLMTKWIFTRK